MRNALLIVTCLLTLACDGGVGRQQYLAQVARTDADFSAMSAASELFKLNNRRYPKQLSELWEQPADAEGWKGPYVKEYPPLDPWGNPYTLVFSADGKEFRIVSHGADGKPGGVEQDMDPSSNPFEVVEAPATPPK